MRGGGRRFRARVSFSGSGVAEPLGAVGGAVVAGVAAGIGGTGRFGGTRRGLVCGAGDCAASEDVGVVAGEAGGGVIGIRGDAAGRLNGGVVGTLGAAEASGVVGGTLGAGLSDGGVRRGT